MSEKMHDSLIFVVQLSSPCLNVVVLTSLEMSVGAQNNHVFGG